MSDPSRINPSSGSLPAAPAAPVAGDWPDASSPKPPKPVRLSLACNQCRKRKVRCDAEQPKCRNCLVRGDVCETHDPRRPNGRSVRRVAGKGSTSPSQAAAQTPSVPGSASATAASPRPGRAEPGNGHKPGRSNGPASATTSLQSGASAAGSPDVALSVANSSDVGGLSSPAVRRAYISWVSRAYQDCNNDRDDGHSTSKPGEAADRPSPDAVLNRDNSSSRVKYLGASSLQSLAVFVDLYLAKQGLQPISQLFRQGMHHVEEFPLPLFVPLPGLPAADVAERYTSTFFARIWPLYPVLDEAAFRDGLASLQQLQSSRPGGLQEAASPTDAPALACAYAVMCIAADEEAGDVTEAGSCWLTAAYSLYGNLVSQPHFGSAQALVLLVIAMSGRGRDGQGWQALAQAIRICHSIGLHRQTPSFHPADEPGDAGSLHRRLNLGSRLWFSCYVLEKVGELETGRPPAIADLDLGHDFPSPPELPPHHPLAYFVAWVSLAKIIGQTSEYVYRRPQSSFSLLQETGRLDLALEDWARSVPEYMRPGTDVLAAGTDAVHGHVVCFLSLQFYQARITLLRMSLVFPSKSYISEVRKFMPSMPNAPRLLQSQSICVEAARAIVRQVLDLADHNIQSRLFNVTQPFLASVVLLLSILKNPQKRAVRADLELLLSGTEYAETQYRRSRQTLPFITGLASLRDCASALFGHNRPNTGYSGDSPAGGAHALNWFDQAPGPSSASLPPAAEMTFPAIPPGSASAGAPAELNPSFLDLLDITPMVDLWNLMGTDLLFDDNRLMWPTN